MNKLIFALPGSEHLRDAVVALYRSSPGCAEVRSFPDGECYVRIDSDVRGKEVIVLCTLHRPDALFLPLFFLAGQAREMGAARVVLLAPYLAYLRQDKAFRPGEAVTSRHFAKLLSSVVDELVTIDPHLHRYNSLEEIYNIGTIVKSSTALMAEWLSANAADPVIIGPDAESEQWVSDLAARTGAPFLILAKNRKGDRAVEVSVPDLERFRGRQVVLIDDIISTGRTMAETIRHVRQAGFPAPLCVAVHAVFGQGAEEALRAAGAADIVSCNTICHHTNRIDISGLLKADSVL